MAIGGRPKEEGGHKDWHLTFDKVTTEALEKIQEGGSTASETLEKAFKPIAEKYGPGELSIHVWRYEVYLSQQIIKAAKEKKWSNVQGLASLADSVKEFRSLSGIPPPDSKLFSIETAAVSHSTPRVNLKITQAKVGNPHVKCQLPSVGFNMFNPNDYPIRVKVEVRPILGRRNLGLIHDRKGYYSGETLHNLNPYEGFVNGSFTIPKECINNTEELTIEVRATIIDQNDREYTRLPVSWTYMRKENMWFFEPRTFTDV